MSVIVREFKEVIESFKVVDTCLQCFYDGKSHMYRPLSAQLRLLLCDTSRKKDNSLIMRLIKNLKITPIKKIIYQDQATFDKTADWANYIRLLATNNLKISIMPFEITEFSNGLEIADLLLDTSLEPILIDDWLDQYISIQPIQVTIRQLIKTVADRGGGAHVHHKEDAYLNILSKSSPSKLGMDVLFTISIARIVQKIGWYIIQFYEKNGAEFTSDDIGKGFDKHHSSVISAAQVPKKLYSDQHKKYNVTSIGNI